MNLIVNVVMVNGQMVNEIVFLVYSHEEESDHAVMMMNDYEDKGMLAFKHTHKHLASMANNVSHASSSWGIYGFC